MRKPLLTLALSALSLLATNAHAQDLLNDLPVENDDRVVGTFKSTRIISAHSVETTKKNHLDFRISHRFGRLNEGAYEFFGLDQAYIRLAFDYGITDKLTVGIGRTNVQKTYDGFLKYRALQQSGTTPVSLALVTGTTINTMRWTPSEQQYLEAKHRYSYYNQVLLARKFSELLSLQLTPTHIHRNLVTGKDDPNDQLAVGLGGRLRLTRSVHLTADYFYQLNEVEDGSTNPIAVGVDIETGGHVFQLYVANTQNMIEPQFIGQTYGKVGKGDLHFGFSVVRTFSFDKKKSTW